MIFIINGMKYDTDKMEKIANVKKWYATNNMIIRAIYGGVGDVFVCELWKSSKGNWLLTHEQDYTSIGEAIEEEEAKNLLMKYDSDKYEELFEEIPDA